MVKNDLAGERQILLDAVFVSFVNSGASAQTTAPLGIFGLHQMATAGAQAQDLAFGRNLETLGGRFFRFNAFGTSHSSNPLSLKKSAQYRVMPRTKQAVF